VNPLHIALLFSALAFSGCAMKAAPSSTYSQLDVPEIGVDEFHELGRVEFNSPIPVHTVCPTGFVKVDVHQSFFGDFARLISLGLYSPAKTVVTCNNGEEYMIGLNHQGLVEVLRQVKQSAEEGMAALP